MNYYEIYHHGVKGMKWGVRKRKKENPSSGRLKDNERVRRGRVTVGKVMGVIGTAAVIGGVIKVGAEIYELAEGFVKLGETAVSTIIDMH